MGTLTLSVEVLEWAAEKIGETLESLSDELAKRESEREAIRSGKLTAKQAERIADKTRIPFGYLFLPEPPIAIHAQIPDLRQAQSPNPLSDDFYEVLEDAKRKQRWFRDYLEGSNASQLRFVGRNSLKSNPSSKEVAADIVATLRLTAEGRSKSRTPDDYFSYLARKAEGAGILVLKSGIVRSNTKRGLSFKEFRGFALCDPIAPLVFVNGKDWQVAWAFTLMHEICHIWVGQSGVSDLASMGDSNRTEYFCNQVAAEILVPETEFLREFERQFDASRLTDSLGQLARTFKVSLLVAARRALSLKKISSAAYREVSEVSANARPPVGSGGNPYASIPIRNSRRLTAALVSSAMGGRTLFREAASLLNIKPDTIPVLARKLEE